MRWCPPPGRGHLRRDQCRGGADRMHDRVKLLDEPRNMKILKKEKKREIILHILPIKLNLAQRKKFIETQVVFCQITALTAPA